MSQIFGRLDLLQPEQAGVALPPPLLLPSPRAQTVDFSIGTIGAWVTALAMLVLMFTIY